MLEVDNSSKGKEKAGCIESQEIFVFHRITVSKYSNYIDIQNIRVVYI